MQSQIRTTRISSDHRRFGRLHTKLGLFTITGTVLLGGTAAAIALWPQPKVTPTTHTALPSGNHIVGYDAQNCNYYSQAKSVGETTHDTVYYEIRQGSKLTDEQLRSSLQAVCEENISNQAMTKLAGLLSKDAPGISSTSVFLVKSVVPGSLTVTLDGHYDTAQMITVPGGQTFTNFSDKLIVRNESAAAAYSDIHVGDTVKLLLQDTDGKSTETWASQTRPTTMKVLAIVKVPALTGDPTSFYTAVGTDLVRVDTCKTSPSGFCRAYDFAK